MKKDFFVPVTCPEYQRFLGGALIGIRRHPSREGLKTPLYETEKKAIRAYKHELNRRTSYEKEFIVLKFRLQSTSPNLIYDTSCSRYYWISCLSKRFYIEGSFFCQRLNPIDIVLRIVR